MKEKTIFVCSECGYESPRWLGKCPQCGAWNSFREIKIDRKKRWTEEKEEVLSLDKIELTGGERIPTGIEEVDRVLGNGFLKGSIVLIGGDPGIGKSTLVLEIARNLAEKGYKILYVTGEESPEQIKQRAMRLKATNKNILIFPGQDLEEIKEIIKDTSPSFLLVDSIQTVFSSELPQAPGSVSQVRECGLEFLRLTKKKKITTVLIGHVTKDGTLAGPRTLEHMMDVVLYLEGERKSGLRILRSSKNRFGSTEEIGIFEMSEEGLREVKDPSLHFVDLNHGEREGTAYTVLLEGKRPLVVEIQALVSPTPFNIPQRVTTGFDPRRLSMLLAVTEKFTGLMLRSMDIFLNVTGGIKIQDSSADLSVVMAMISSFRKKALPTLSVFLGEVGLGGEIRPVSGLNKRIEEAKRLGFNNIYIPSASSPVKGDKRLKVYNNIKEVIESCFG